MCEKTRNKCEGIKWKYLLRQLLVNSGAWSSFFILGLNMGAPTVVLPQLRNETNSTEAVSPEESSWLTYHLTIIFNYSGLPWGFILPVVASFYGRKMSHTIVCCSTLVGFIIFYCSHDVNQIAISEVFQGPLMASYITISVIVITEYTSSEYRGLFLTIKSATFFWGILASNFIGTFFHWTHIPLFGIICAIYNLITVYYWPESPLWLANKGCFDKCAKSHKWLKGSNANSQKELEELISNKQIVDKKLPFKAHAVAMLKGIIKKQFYKPVLLSILLHTLYLFSGKLVYTIYAIDILKKIIHDTPTAYTGMLILDGVTVFIMYVGCALAKTFKRRPLLLTSASISVLFLFLLSLYLYLVTLSIIPEDKYITISMLVGFSIAIGSGPMILATSISGELIPVEARSLSLVVIVIATRIMNGVFVKVSLHFFSSFGMHGTFLLFAVSSSLCLVILYIYLPETKDKSLFEIADCVSNVKAGEEEGDIARDLLPVTGNNITIVPENGKTLEEVR